MEEWLFKKGSASRGPRAWHEDFLKEISKKEKWTPAEILAWATATATAGYHQRVPLFLDLPALSGSLNKIWGVSDIFGPAFEKIAERLSRASKEWKAPTEEARRTWGDKQKWTNERIEKESRERFAEMSSTLRELSSCSSIKEKIAENAGKNHSSSSVRRTCALLAISCVAKGFHPMEHGDRSIEICMAHLRSKGKTKNIERLFETKEIADSVMASAALKLIDSNETETGVIFLCRRESIMRACLNKMSEEEKKTFSEKVASKALMPHALFIETRLAKTEREKGIPTDRAWESIWTRLTKERFEISEERFEQLRNMSRPWSEIIIQSERIVRKRLAPDVQAKYEAEELTEAITQKHGETRNARAKI